MGSATSHRQSPSEPNSSTPSSSEENEDQDQGIQVDVKSSPKELVFVMKHQLNPTKSVSDSATDREALIQQFSILPIFPAAPVSTGKSKRVSNGVGVTKMLSYAEDVMTPCNTIIMQNTIDGKIQVSRTQKEREKSPNKLSLDRRGLTMFPILVGEGKLRLLSLQHNLLTKLERMALLCLQHLVFLDIYNNQLENIAALECLRNLRILLLGKNRIKTVEGLSRMDRLEVLDLHGNQITKVRCLKNHRELKILNLASNEIKIISTRELEGLVSLQELNLRRNQIKKVSGFEETPQLIKLFLSNNIINSIEDLSGIRKLNQLEELSLDGNKVLLNEDCVLFVTSYIPSVQIFGQIRITKDVRNVAKMWRLHKEFSESLNLIPEADGQDAHNSQGTSSRHNTSQLRRRCTDNAKTAFKSSSQCANQMSTMKTSATSYNKTATTRRASFLKKKTISNDSCYGSETSVEYFRLPPIMSLSRASTEDCGNVVVRNDPHTSMESNKSFCSAHGESVSSSEKSEESSASTNSESETSEEDEMPDRTAVPSITAATPHVNTEKEKFITLEDLVIQDPPDKTKVPNAGSVRNRTKKPRAPIEKIKEQGKDYFVQISGRYLVVTGRNSAKYIDKAWSTEKAKDVTTVRFTCVLFALLAPIFHRIKFRFPNIEHLIFNECEFNYIGQLNALAAVQGFKSLEIQSKGNAIVKKNEWRSYAIFRLRHWGVQKINNTPITEDEIRQAEDKFRGLSDMVLWLLPESLPISLLNKLRLEINANTSAKQWLYKLDPDLRSIICRETLEWKLPTLLPPNELNLREKGHQSLMTSLVTACTMVLKLQELERQWDHIRQELVCDALKDYYPSTESHFTVDEKINNLKPL